MMTVCPVCKTEIEDNKARGTSEKDGKTYHFCCKSCKKQFDEAPDKYSTGK